MGPFDSIGDTITRWLLVGSCVALTAGVVAWHYGKHLHRRWLNSIPHRHSSRSYGHSPTAGHPHVHNITPPPYDWKKETV